MALKTYYDFVFLHRHAVCLFEGLEKRVDIFESHVKLLMKQCFRWKACLAHDGDNCILWTPRRRKRSKNVVYVGRQKNSQKQNAVIIGFVMMRVPIKSSHIQEIVAVGITVVSRCVGRTRLNSILVIGRIAQNVRIISKQNNMFIMAPMNTTLKFLKIRQNSNRHIAANAKK